ncbi:helix-turn-helix domain-containing protein [Alicyclobacillus fodiniaquatilis]|uniref:Helix-turn-helix domain-containing protein n=1 Tax=Alicyclobacillus fodiniaquatilis TaxID=1661150 RepID=A0ABW4JJE2_9BACL
MTDAQALGERISRLRHHKHMTQEQLGQLLHVSAQAVSKWENGESSPDISLVVRIANILGCTTDFMLGNVCTLAAMLPQIKVELRKMTPEHQSDFLGEIIDTIGQPISADDHALALENSALPAIHLGPTGLGVWMGQREVCLLCDNSVFNGSE